VQAGKDFGIAVGISRIQVFRLGKSTLIEKFATTVNSVGITLASSARLLESNAPLV
jgi:hypothetical protein